MIWHYAAPSYLKINQLESAAKGYVHPFFGQNYKLFAPTPILNYQYEWRLVGDFTWISDQEELDQKHDFWKGTSVYQKNVGMYNRIYWIHYDYHRYHLPNAIDQGWVERNNMEKSMAWRLPKKYLESRAYHESWVPGTYEIKFLFDNVKEETCDSLIVEVEIE